MWLESQGELQLLLEGEEPQAAGGARSARGGAAALRARGAGTCLGGRGEARGPGAGALWRLWAAVLCKELRGSA